MTCHEGYLDLMKYLLRQGMDLNETDDEGDSPLHYAAFGYVYRLGIFFHVDPFVV